MRKVLITLLAITVFGVGAAFAQNNASVKYDTTQWAGVSIGYPFSIYYGVNDALGQNIDIRGRLSSYFYDFGVGADVLTTVTQLQDVPISIYAGGGPNFDYIWAGGEIGLGLSGLVGGEYRINQKFGAFAELGAGYTFYFGGVLGTYGLGLGGFSPRGAVGVNYHF